MLNPLRLPAEVLHGIEKSMLFISNYFKNTHIINPKKYAYTFNSEPEDAWEAILTKSRAMVFKSTEGAINK